MDSFSKVEGGKKDSYTNCHTNGNPTQNVSKDRDQMDVHKMMASKRWNHLSLQMTSSLPNNANPL